MQIEPVRRRSNGTIDIDSYRREALMLREQTRTEFFTKLAQAARPFFGGMMFIVAYAYALHLLFPGPAVAEVPDAIAVPGEVLVTTLHAAGAQIYECKADSADKLVWQFREPIATLFMAGKTVGRHYAGPNWEMTDGSAVRGRVAAQSPGATPNDIALLRLEATSWSTHLSSNAWMYDCLLIRIASFVVRSIAVLSVVVFTAAFAMPLALGLAARTLRSKTK